MSDLVVRWSVPDRCDDLLVPALAAHPNHGLAHSIGRFPTRLVSYSDRSAMFISIPGGSGDVRALDFGCHHRALELRVHFFGSHGACVRSAVAPC